MGMRRSARASAKTSSISEGTLGYKYEETIQDVATGEWYTPEKRAEMLKKDPTRPVLVFKMPESAIIDWLKLPGVSVVTDGMPMIVVYYV
jgi:hypothetical protein